MNSRFLSMCGIARRAGKVIAGTNMVTSAIRSKNKPFLVILSEDASDNSKKRITDSCAFYSVELINTPYTKDDLGSSVGNHGGASVIAILDEGLSQAILKLHSNNADSTGSQEVK